MKTGKFDCFDTEHLLTLANRGDGRGMYGHLAVVLEEIDRTGAITATEIDAIVGNITARDFMQLEVNTGHATSKAGLLYDFILSVPHLTFCYGRLGFGSHQGSLIEVFGTREGILNHPLAPHLHGLDSIRDKPRFEIEKTAYGPHPCEVQR